MGTDKQLSPTLWRTCRVLANRPRLRILQLLFEKRWRCVEDIALETGIAEATASQYLKALSARGLISAAPRGKYVCYAPSGDRAVRHSLRLINGLKRVFECEEDPAETIFRYSTAFTHERRIKIVRALRDEELRVGELGTRTGISPPALLRHVDKLVRRGFVEFVDGKYRCRRCVNRFGQLLLDIASS